MATYTETILYIRSNSFRRKLKIYIQNRKHENFCIFVTSNNFHFQNLKVVGPLGGKFDFFSPLRFEIQSDFDYRTSKIKFYSVRALKYYLNEKNLTHGRVTTTISKFSPQIFETYFKNQRH